MKRIRVQRFGAFDDTNKKWPPQFFNCRDIEKLPDVGYRLKLTNGDTQTIAAGDFDIEEVWPDGTIRPIPR
jgi:hypothetical protein